MPLISAKFLCDICVTLKALCMKRYKRTALCLKTRLYRQTDRQTDRQRDRQRDRERERETETQRLLVTKSSITHFISQAHAGK